MFRSNFRHVNKIFSAMKRVTRQTTAQIGQTESKGEEFKPDLSKYALSKKPKISSTMVDDKSDSKPPKSGSRETKKKREHVTITADTESSESKSAKHYIKPEMWELVLDNLRQMRQKFDAPVDSMGCHKCHDEKATPKVIRFQALISLMLSSQTKDQINHAAMLKLQSHGCTVENLISTSDEQLGQLIYPVSFWKTKVKNIKKACEILKNDYDSDIPRTIDDLCKLPGVGPKMAHLCMKSAWNEVTGIGVDTHVHRISNRLGWAKGKTPEDTRKQLEGWLPRDLWGEVNLLMVGFGQQVCGAVRPQCEQCLNRTICPFALGKKK